MSKNIKDFKICQKPREENKKANALTNLASTFDFVLDRNIHLEFLLNPSIEVARSVCQTEASPTWMDDIIAYLQNDTLPPNKLQAYRIQYRSARFCLLHGILYKRSFSGPLLRCLQPEKGEYVLRKIHESICGNYSGIRSLVRKVVRQGYFWTQME